MNKIRVRIADEPLHRLPVPAAVLLLGAALMVGVGAVRAQDPADGIDGTWTVDTSIGDFDSDLQSGTYVGFRVAEVLNPGGSAEAIGRTPVVSGQLEASGTTIENVLIEADLTAIRSDRDRREPAIQRSLETGDFPIASFVSSEPVDLGEIPGEEPFVASVPGTLTIRDVSQAVTIDLEGLRVGDTVVVVGTLPVDFTDFGVTMPTAPIVVSVEDTGDIEWQLFFTRSAGSADDEMITEDAGGEDATDGEMTGDESAEE